MKYYCIKQHNITDCGAPSGFVVGALGGTVILPGVGTIGGAGAGALVGLEGGVAWGAGSYAAGQLYQGIFG
ncbi:MAG: hypothetical protein PUB89_11215 [Oscillospiraceae bacterium]|nr:hypothetical protein [Oscillospiraceae bacterium]